MRKLRRLRAEKGLTMDALEERTGVSKRTISELERGMRAPQALTLAKLAAALGVDIDDLLEPEAPKDPPPPRSLPELLGRAGVGDRHLAMSTTELVDAFEGLPYPEALQLARKIVSARVALKPILAQYRDTDEGKMLTALAAERNVISHLCFQVIAERERGEAAAQGDLDRLERIERELEEVA